MIFILIFHEIICISSSKLIPNLFFTFSFINLINFKTSDALAPPKFIMKFACFSEISARPIFFPFNPHFSISSPAENPDGFLKHYRLTENSTAAFLFCNLNIFLFSSDCFFSA